MTNVQPFPNYAQMSETKIEMHPSKGWEPVSNLFWWKLQELDKKEAIHFFAKKFFLSEWFVSSKAFSATLIRSLMKIVNVLKWVFLEEEWCGRLLNFKLG